MGTLPIPLQTIMPLTQVPANRIGFGHFKLDHLWAALCMLGAVYFMFRS